MVSGIVCIVPCLIQPHSDHTHYAPDHTPWWLVLIVVLTFFALVALVGWLVGDGTGARRRDD